MIISIDTVNEAKRQLLAMNDGIKGKPLIKSVAVVLGDDGFRLEVTREQAYKWTPPTEVLGVPVVSD